MKSSTAFSWTIAIVAGWILNLGSIFHANVSADEKSGPPATSPWQSDAGLLRPFWQGDVVHGESVQFIKDPSTGEATVQLLFPVRAVVNLARGGLACSRQPGV